jgi:hypothetical protein
MNKIKKQFGDPKYAGGLFTTILTRQRNYFALLALLFLVFERLFVLFRWDLGITEFLEGLSLTAYLVCGVCGLGLFAMWIYVDLKFILPGERATNSYRDPCLTEIREGIDDIRRNC